MCLFLIELQMIYWLIRRHLSMGRVRVLGMFRYMQWFRCVIQQLSALI